MHPLLIVGLLIAFALTAWASIAVRSTFAKYARVPLLAQLTGAEVARRVLIDAGVEGVRVEAAAGYLSDHYDPGAKVLRLSPQVYGSRSVAAAGVAAHEAGHALQDAKRYGPLVLRNLAVPTASLGSSLGFPLLLIGLLLQSFALAVAGMVLFAGVVLFQLITLPVEIDASRRAIHVLAGAGIVSTRDEEAGVKAVLTAAAMTYVAAALTGVLYLLHFASMLFGGRD